MKTEFTASPDGLSVAYDRRGGGRRQEWAAAGYVQRLKKLLAIVSMDLRGHGESPMPSEPSCYAIEKQAQDILQVADKCALNHFSIAGISYGGKVGRYAAVHSDRVDMIVLMGTPLGPGAAGQRRQEAIGFAARWPPILEAWQACKLDLVTLSQNERELLLHANIAAMLGWVRAMLNWPTVTPADFRCPALWLIGSVDQNAMECLEEYGSQIPGSNLRVEILKGLDHEQVFEEPDRALPLLLAFIKGEDVQNLSPSTIHN